VLVCIIRSSDDLVMRSLVIRSDQAIRNANLKFFGALIKAVNLMVLKGGL
jgi:hypothetical protein